MFNINSFQYFYVFLCVSFMLYVEILLRKRMTVCTVSVLINEKGGWAVSVYVLSYVYVHWFCVRFELQDSLYWRNQKESNTHIISEHKGISVYKPKQLAHPPFSAIRTHSHTHTHMIIHFRRRILVHYIKVTHIQTLKY